VSQNGFREFSERFGVVSGHFGVIRAYFGAVLSSFGAVLDWLFQSGFGPFQSGFGRFWSSFPSRPEMWGINLPFFAFYLPPAILLSVVVVVCHEQKLEFLSRAQSDWAETWWRPRVGIPHSC
jgi:hypothetical protein